jgi:hypothetical protein
MDNRIYFNLVKDQTTSLRIHNNKEKVFLNIHQKFKDFSKQIDMVSSSRSKIDIVIEIFNYSIINFNICVLNPSILKIFGILMKRGVVINSDIQDGIRDGNKWKTCHQKFLKVYKLFREKYLNFVFKNMKKHIYIIKECPICFENITKKQSVQTYCNHSFHKYCLYQHMENRNNCPICRAQIF